MEKSVCVCVGVSVGHCVIPQLTILLECMFNMESMNSQCVCVCVSSVSLSVSLIPYVQRGNAMLHLCACMFVPICAPGCIGMFIILRVFKGVTISMKQYQFECVCGVCVGVCVDLCVVCVVVC